MKLRASPRLRPLSDVQYWTPELLYLLPQKGRVWERKKIFFLLVFSQPQNPNPKSPSMRSHVTPSRHAPVAVWSEACRRRGQRHRRVTEAPGLCSWGVMRGKRGARFLLPRSTQIPLLLFGIFFTFSCFASVFRDFRTRAQFRPFGRRFFTFFRRLFTPKSPKMLASKPQTGLPAKQGSPVQTFFYDLFDLSPFFRHTLATAARTHAKHEKSRRPTKPARRLLLLHLRRPRRRDRRTSNPQPIRW
jgi:hypothetical protein